MKIEKFLNWIQDKLLNYPDIDIKTVKIFIDKFGKMLSNKERKRFFIPLEMISEFTLKQISLDDFIGKLAIENLDNELNNLKNDNNEIQTKKR